MKGKIFNAKDVKSIASLAKIPVTPEEVSSLAKGFNTTIAVVDELFQANMTGVEPTHQVTGLENVFRKDEIDESRMLSQNQALSNAPRTHNGYFVVEQVIEQES